MNPYFFFISDILSQKECVDSKCLDINWRDYYVWGARQSVLGVIYEGLIKYGDIFKNSIPQDVLFQWVGDAEQIKVQNQISFYRTKEVIALFAENGFRSCILKGQGNALMYDNPYSRVSGDIDIWVDGSREDINKFVRDRYPNTFEQLNHIDFPVFDDVHVEVHYTPCSLMNLKNRQFQNYVHEQKDVQMSHQVEMPNGLGMINVPTTEFNCVFQIAHVMKHFFTEGIGLRHFIDYYYLLKNCHSEGVDVKNIQALLGQFGLLRFARGIMWIEQECMALDNQYLIVEPDERRGKVILEEMLAGGNFGFFDERYKSRNRGYWFRGVTDVYRLMKLSSVFPSESFWKTVRKIENQKWKIRNIMYSERSYG